jgi:hypothetical protein
MDRVDLSRVKRVKRVTERKTERKMWEWESFVNG